LNLEEVLPPSGDPDAIMSEFDLTVFLFTVFCFIPFACIVIKLGVQAGGCSLVPAERRVKLLYYFTGRPTPDINKA
jgi:hypothetical protein